MMITWGNILIQFNDYVYTYLFNINLCFVYDMKTQSIININIGKRNDGSSTFFNCTMLIE